MKGSHYSSAKLKERYDSIFEDAYASLNEKQKIAVDHIEGPVMVNAGPGTGKTQLLAVRIGKILQTQDVAPHNILCLTYTDAATIAMRNRLVEIIGPIAHKIHIHTYHSFCNQVIQENLDIFGGYRQLESISDLESVDIYREIIDSIPEGNILKRYKYDKYFEHKRLKNLFELMKKENISVQQFHNTIDKFLESKKESEDFIAKRKSGNYQKGDFRDDWFEKEKRKYDELKAGVDFFPKLKEYMDREDRYDFNDMILWVLREFENTEDLLIQYQERYLYFLVDEYQDTNGSQNTLLSQLISYWDKPNVFVVGDDDQAIFKFQGANLKNIIGFKEKYNPLTIVLEENYRSNQQVLDSASELIKFNSERLVNEDPELTKNIIASGPYKDDRNPVHINTFNKNSEEFAHVAHQLESDYLQDLESFNDTAVIYRKHRQIEDLVNVLEKRQIPINIKRRINILEQPLVKNFLNILWYISEEYKMFGKGQYRLFEILHYNYWNIDSIDIGLIALKCQKKDEEDNYIEWRKGLSDDSILSSMNLKSKEAILKASFLLEKWIKELPELTLQTLFENIINEGGVLRYIMSSPEKSWLLQVVSTFFDFIKKETAKSPDLGLEHLLLMIKKMLDNNIELAINKIISSDQGVNFITAHSAKGLEFKKVYMIGCTKNIWDKSPGSFNNFKYPDNINSNSKTSEEDERRLFYVGMTRAKTDLNISYSRFTEEGKEQGQSTFVDEISGSTELNIQNPVVTESLLADFYYNLLKKEDKKIDLIEPDLINNWLKSYQMSVTHLNKFLKCPLTFYFESMLKIPHARNAAAGFGSAIHDTLRAFFVNYSNTGSKSLENLLSYYQENLKRYKSHFTEDEFLSYKDHGRISLTALLEEKKDSWFDAPKIVVEEKLANAEYKGIPLKGFLDKVEIYKNDVHVIDYKTGNSSSYNTTKKMKAPNDNDPKGGNYWRQLVFYKILLDSDKKHNWNMVRGVIEFVEPDRKTEAFKLHECIITPEDIDTVGEQIVNTMDSIKKHDFNKTCEDEECYWCAFVKENYVLNPSFKESEHSYD